MSAYHRQDVKKNKLKKQLTYPKGYLLYRFHVKYWNRPSCKRPNERKWKYHIICKHKQYCRSESSRIENIINMTALKYNIT
jgi:hypothetical protein